MSNTVIAMDARDGHSIVAFAKDVAESDTLESDLKPISDRVAATSDPAVLVDLTAPEYISSMVVAAVVRLWKTIEKAHGRMAVVVRSEDHPVSSVLHAAGLTKVWPVVTSHEMAVHELGLSKEALTEERERRLSTILAPAALLVAAVLLSPFLFGEESTLAKSLARFGIMGLGSLAFLLGLVSITREEGGKRLLAAFVSFGAFVTVVVAAVLWLKAPPVEMNLIKNTPPAELEAGGEKTEAKVKEKAETSTDDD